MKKSRKEKSVLELNRHRSPMGEIWHRLKKNKGAIIGFVFLCILAFFAIFADVIFDYETQVIAVNSQERLLHPSKEHWLGTDHLGRDVLIRLLYGAKYSLPIGAVAVVLGLTVGLALGAVSGYYGGKVDDIIMRLLDILGSIPSFLLAMILIITFNSKGMLPMMVALGVGSITGFARTARTSVMMYRNQEFVESALAIGETHNEALFKHVVPNSLSRIIVSASLRMGSAIISASSLSYLGLGIKPPSPEWGAMLSEGRAYVRDFSYLTIFPGLIIVFTVIAFSMMGDGLRDAMDPKLKH